MATTLPVLLLGGPCNGETKYLTLEQIASDETVCQKVTYFNDVALATIRNPVVFTTKDYQAPTQPKPPPTHVTEAWTRWMRALGHTGPLAHNRVRAATARINRIAR